MQVNKINNSTTTFKSRFVPNKCLEGAFASAEHSCDRNFVKTVKAILNDGKDDCISIQKSGSMRLLVNGELQEETSMTNYYGNPAVYLIGKYAKRLFNTDVYAEKYQDLSDKEKTLIQEQADVIKMLSENMQNTSNYIEEVQKAIKDMKQKIDENAKNEIKELKKLVFGE